MLERHNRLVTGVLTGAAVLLLQWACANGGDTASSLHHGLVFLGLFSRLEKPRLLESPRRDILHSEIRARPGLSYLELRKLLHGYPEWGRVGFGSLSYQLSRLEQFGLITSERVGRARRYFDATTGSQRRARDVAWLWASRPRRLASIVRRTPGISQTELLNEANCSRATLAYNMNHLVRRNLVEKRCENRKLSYWPTSWLEDVAKVLGEQAFPPAPTGPGHH